MFARVFRKKGCKCYHSEVASVGKVRSYSNIGNSTEKRFHCRSFPMNSAKSVRTAFCKKLKFRTATSEEVKNITSYPRDNLHQLSL